MLKVGITGGIGSGKTTVCKVFETLGIPVYYSDEESKILLDENAEVKTFIVTTFGKGILRPEGVIDRRALAERIFNDKEALTALNAVVHPAVGKHFEDWLKKQSGPYILKEAAILFESGAYKQVDKVITVTAPDELKISRAMKRDNVSREEVTGRMKNQQSDATKTERSQFVIHNDEEQLLIPQVLGIHRQLLGT